MTKKEMRLRIIGKQRRRIEVDLMMQAVIALGRDLAERKPKQTGTRRTRAATTADTGAQP